MTKTVAVLLFGLAAGAQAHDMPARAFVAGGVSYFSTSQSNVPLHLLKPTVRAGAAWELRGVDLGVELMAAATGEAGYRLIGALLTVEAPLYRGPVYELGLAAGVGLGSIARILAHDLASGAPVGLWFKAGFAMRWWLPGDVVGLGLDLQSAHLTTVDLSGSVVFRF